MAYVQGKAVLLKVKTDGAALTALTGEITCTLNRDVAIDEIKTKSSGAWRGGSPGVKGWTVAGEGAVSTTGDAALDAIETAWEDSTELDISIIEPSPLKTYTGKAYVQSFVKSAPAEGHYNVTFELFGNGALTSDTTAAS